MYESCGRPELSARALCGERLDADELTRWRRHVVTCSACRTQNAIDHDLRRLLADVPPPTLRDGFVERFERRRAGSAVAGVHVWLRVYWLGFALVTTWVLAGLDWTRFETWLPALAAIWLTIVVTSPILALAGPLRRVFERAAPAPFAGAVHPGKGGMTA